MYSSHQYILTTNGWYVPAAVVGAFVAPAVCLGLSFQLPLLILRLYWKLGFLLWLCVVTQQSCEQYLNLEHFVHRRQLAAVGLAVADAAVAELLLLEEYLQGET